MSDFPERLSKKLPDNFESNTDSATTEEIKKIILDSESSIYDVDKEAELDEKLNAAKAIVKDLSKAYRDKKACESAKIKYCLWVLENRGVSVR